MKKINFRSILVNVLTAISIGALAACSNGAITPSTVDNSGSNTTSNMVEKSEAQAPEQDETSQAIDELDTSSSIEELLTAEEVSLTENCLLIETDTGFKMAMDYPGSLNKKGIFIVDSQYGIDRSDTQPPVVNASRGGEISLHDHVRRSFVFISHHQPKILFFRHNFNSYKLLQCGGDQWHSDRWIARVDALGTCCQRRHINF